jgi:CubicO group peptidase (beta-lactamase class C family)|eukprot:COSAG01_NODE_9300_length_2489_cov_36.374059_2_plen_85_part_00
MCALQGTVSYGLGALVVGRILEVLHERQSGSFLRFASICEQKLFAPLGMSSAAFYLEDDDPRIAKIPQLCARKFSWPCTRLRRV